MYKILNGLQKKFVIGFFIYYVATLPYPNSPFQFHLRFDNICIVSSNKEYYLRIIIYGNIWIGDIVCLYIC